MPLILSFSFSFYALFSLCPLAGGWSAESVDSLPSRASPTSPSLHSVHFLPSSPQSEGRFLTWGQSRLWRGIRLATGGDKLAPAPLCSPASSAPFPSLPPFTCSSDLFEFSLTNGHTPLPRSHAHTHLTQRNVVDPELPCNHCCCIQAIELTLNSCTFTPSNLLA